VLLHFQETRKKKKDKDITKMSNKDYTQIYDLIFTSLKVDGITQEVAQSSARRITDAVWDLHLCLNFRKQSFQQTIDVVKDIVESQLS